MDQEAFRWLNAAAEQGVAEAQYYLAQFHEQGIGTDKNQDLADALRPIQASRLDSTGY